MTVAIGWLGHVPRLVAPRPADGKRHHPSSLPLQRSTRLASRLRPTGLRLAREDDPPALATPAPRGTTAAGNARMAHETLAHLRRTRCAMATSRHAARRPTLARTIARRGETIPRIASHRAPLEGDGRRPFRAVLRSSRLAARCSSTASASLPPSASKPRRIKAPEHSRPLARTAEKRGPQEENAGGAGDRSRRAPRPPNARLHSPHEPSAHHVATVRTIRRAFRASARMA